MVGITRDLGRERGVPSAGDFVVVPARARRPQAAAARAVSPQVRDGPHFYISVTVVRADQGNHTLVAGELNVAVGRNFLLTAHKRSSPTCSP